MSNAKKAKPGIKLNLGGETLTLVFDLWALVEVERKVGKTVPELLSGGSMEGILVMLWAALHRYHPDISEEEVGHMITLENINYVSQTLGEALSAASPEAEQSDGGEKNVKSQSSGTGSKSGQ